MSGEVSYGDFYRVENAFSNLYWYPCSEFTLSEVQALAPDGSDEITVETAWFVKAKNGEMWEGPFDSQEEAEEFLEGINGL